MKSLKPTRLAALAIGSVLLAASETARACATCFGNTDGPLADGMNMGIFTLLGVLGVVMAGTISFFVFLARRAATVNGNDTADDLPNSDPS